jgi:Flp pilus assembly protein TadG
MIEAVIVLPVVLMLIFAVAEFSIVFSRWQSLTNAAREGARTSIVYRTDCDPALVDPIVRQVVKDYALSAGITLVDADIAVVGACVDPNSSVTVDSDYQYLVLSNLAPGLASTITITGTSVMRNE